MKKTHGRAILIGNYCHDILLKDNTIIATSLGGAASFISNIFYHLSITCNYISKVGPDFKHTARVITPPIISPNSKTTLFHAHFTSTNGPQPSSDRTLNRVHACDPVRPGDIPMGQRFDIGLAVGVGGEILPETLEKLIEICDVVFVDIQGLIREFDENDGKVRLINLKETKFYPLMSKIGFLKASSEEAEYMDVEEIRKMCCVIVTNGEKGCKLYWKDGEVEIFPFRTVQVDPTGAGDSLLGGFVAGLVFGLCVVDAALLGNFFGALTVSEIGLPKFDNKLLERVKEEAQNRVLQCAQHQVGDEDELYFSKPLGHEQFYTSLDAIRQAFSLPIQECKRDLPDAHNPTAAVNLSVKHQCNGQ